MKETVKLKNKNTKLNQNNNTDPNMKIKKILLIILCAIIVGLGILYFFDSYIYGPEQWFFTKHFVSGIVLACIGFVILILVNQSNQRISGDGKGDALMEKVAIVAFVLALISVAVSFVQ